MVAWFLLIIPDALMLALFPIELLLILMPQSADRMIFCEFISFCTVSLAITSSGSSVVVAHQTFNMVRGEKHSNTSAVAWNFLSFLLGIAISSVYLSLKERDVYSFGEVQNECYFIRHDFMKAYLLGTLLVFPVSFIVQAFFYIRANSIYTKHLRSQQGGRYLFNQRNGSVAIRDRGLQMLVVFFGCFSTNICSQVMVIVGKYPGAWQCIIGAWAIKMLPLLHFLLLHQSLARVKMNKVCPSRQNTARKHKVFVQIPYVTSKNFSSSRFHKEQTQAGTNTGQLKENIIAHLNSASSSISGAAIVDRLVTPLKDKIYSCAHRYEPAGDGVVIDCDYINSTYSDSSNRSFDEKDADGSVVH